MVHTRDQASGDRLTEQFSKNKIFGGTDSRFLLNSANCLLFENETTKENFEDRGFDRVLHPLT